MKYNSDIKDYEEEVINALMDHIPKEDMRDLMNMKRKNDKEQFVARLLELTMDRPEVQEHLIVYYLKKKEAEAANARPSGTSKDKLR